VPSEERWQEAQWQFRRWVAMAISNLLIERGSAVTSMGVYLRGQRPTREKWFFPDQNVVVEFNGRYLVCDHVPYILDISKEQKPQMRAKAYQRRQELANSAVGQYMSLLDQSQELRTYAEDSLSALGARIRIPVTRQSVRPEPAETMKGAVFSVPQLSVPSQCVYISA